MFFEDKTIAQCREWLDQATVEQVEAELPLLLQDKRTGIKALVKQWQKKQQKEKQQMEHWLHMNREEISLRREGFTYIAGVDEVGRGPLAGPVTAAAVILPEDFFLPGINDSKQLSPLQREQYAMRIKEKAIAYAIVHIEAQVIDQINIYQATRRAMHLALEKLTIQPQYVLIDAMKLSLSMPSKSIIKGDSHSVSIAAASIIAKQDRDALMVEQANRYPYYGFERNMGYGTAVHLEGLKKHGVTPLHRKSFLPVQNLEI